MTNKEIAQAQFITEKTVEGNLRNPFRKLEIASRIQLPAVLGTNDRGTERTTS